MAPQWIPNVHCFVLVMRGGGGCVVRIACDLRNGNSRPFREQGDSFTLMTGNIVSMVVNDLVN